MGYLTRICGVEKLNVKTGYLDQDLLQKKITAG